MSLAAASSSYPLLNIFWTILEIFLWVIWFWILIRPCWLIRLGGEGEVESGEVA